MTPTHTTIVITADGKIHDLGLDQHPPRHNHGRPTFGGQPTTEPPGFCPKCRIVDARTALISEVRP